MSNIQDLDQLVFHYVFSDDLSLKKSIAAEIKTNAEKSGIYFASIYNFYQAFAHSEISGFTVPAINLRGMTYDFTQTIFQLINKYQIGPVIFEIARSEMEYTRQTPEEIAVVTLASALKTNYQGPIFLQGDHCQFSRKRFSEDAQKEIINLKNYLQSLIDAGFYNIDIDASTLVDLEKSDINEQQKNNFTMTAELTKFIRSAEKTIINIGGEIGHIGGRNSTVTDFEAFITNYQRLISNENIIDISKVSVQTGTSHGGIPDAQGNLQNVNVDFNVLNNIGIAAKRYGLAGTVQHGASTLPIGLFNHFPKNHTVEIHLATGFQNTMFKYLPTNLVQKMDQWILTNLQTKKKPEWTEQQFIYKMRKKTLGQFKKELWSLNQENKEPVFTALNNQLEQIFSALNVFKTRNILDKYINN